MFAKTALSIALAAASLAASAAPISIVASDNFDSYATGALSGASGGTGFSGPWAGSASVSVVGTVANDSPMTGQALQFTSPDDPTAATRTLSQAISADRVLVAFQFQFNGGAIGDNDFLALWFGNSTGPNIGLKANCGTGSCSADMFARTTGSAGQFKHDLTIGDTVSVLGYLQKLNGSSVYNRYSLWVGEDLGDVETLGAADAVFDGASSVTSFSTIGFRTANLDGASDSLLVDNLRIAVVPTPGTLALAGLALLGLGAARRRRA